MRRKLFLFAIFLFLILLITSSYMEESIEYFQDQREYIGKIVNIKEFTDERTKLIVKLDSGKKVLVTIYNCNYSPQSLWKAQIVFSGTIDKPPGQRNPGCFDYRRQLRSEGISGLVTTNRIQITASYEDSFENRLIQKRFDFIDSLSARYKGIISGILFGEKGYIDEDIYEQFRENGTAHILAVSGLHVGVIYELIRKLFKQRMSQISLATTTSLLLIYCLLSLWSFSAIRATSMILIKEWGTYYDKRYDMLTAASVIAIIFMIYNPAIIYNTGFQMSFLAVVSISFFQRLIPVGIPDGISVMLAVNLGLLPYQIFQFNLFSLSSLVANIPIVYLAGILMPFALIQFTVYSIIGYAGPLGIITNAITQLTVKTNQWLSFGEYGHYDVISMPLWLFASIYLTMFFVASEFFEIMHIRKNHKILIFIEILILFVSVFAGTLNYNPLKNADLLFLDVGQGDCVHIKTAKSDVLIDGGGNTDYNVGEKTLKPYLLKNGVRKVDMALATHLHTDHYKGLCELYDDGKINKIMHSLSSGTCFKVDENIEIKTIWPLEISGEKGQDENENCSVFMVYYNDYKILITGDLDSVGEEKLVSYYKGTDTLKAHILKIGHHGSKYSTCDAFLDAVDPGFAVIQVGKNNYGHPNPKVIEKCEQKGIIVLRNDTHGCVGFSLSGDEITYGIQSKQN